jgi:hypothetical protein
MGSVRNATDGAWVLQGRLLRGNPAPLTEAVLSGCAFPEEHLTSGSSLGVTVWDLFYVGLTIFVFAVLLLILKGIETFER